MPKENIAKEKATNILVLCWPLTSEIWSLPQMTSLGKNSKRKERDCEGSIAGTLKTVTVTHF